MERVGVRELRQNASQVLAKVKAGQRVEVTERGELVAVLVPPTAAATARERRIAGGQLRPGSGPLRFPRRMTASLSSERVLEDLRDDR